ncbi:hypothetical protein REH65_29770 [Saccharopolyspora sp. ID03-671]|uniref:hypothetical protein n=1 Tax=Saccharopolyspora sp. ID03-671 TaxID=3073066 RepID=UPI00324CBD53
MARSSTDAPGSSGDAGGGAPGGGRPGSSSGGGQQPPGLSQSFSGPAPGKGTGMLPDAMDAMTEHLNRTGDRLSAIGSKLGSQTVSTEAYGLVGSGVSGSTNQAITKAADTTRGAAGGSKDAGAAVRASKETAQLHDDNSAARLRDIDPDTDVQPGRAEPASTGPQGNDGPRLRESQNGEFGVAGNKAYADKATIERYAARLAPNSRITLEAGKPLDGTFKHEIVPVFKSAEDVPRPLKAEHEPIAGESEQQRAEKLAAFHKSLDNSMADIVKKQGEIHASFQEANARIFPGESAEKVVADKHKDAAMNLAQQKMGMPWIAAHHEEMFGTKPPTEKQYQAMFSDMVVGHGATLDAERRATTDGLRMTMPNDCKQGAMQLTGRDAAELSSVNNDPQPGQNYYKNFSDKTGWENHFATVVGKDGNSDLTFETAADFSREQESSKTYGYFEMYERNGPDGQGSFDSEITAANDRYAERKTKAFG